MPVQALPGSMKNILPPFIHNIMYNLRGGFLVRPLIIALVLGSLGNLLPHLEHAYPVLTTGLPTGIFPSRSEPAVAQTILGTIAAAVMTVVSIVFAILLMTLTLASMQFSPRIIVSFSQDRVTQQTLGIFLGTFLYCLAALPFAHTLPQPEEPVLTVLGSMLLSILCVAWLLFFIHHISQAISVNHIVDRIAVETEAIIDETMPMPRRTNRLAAPPPDTDIPADSRARDLASEQSGYVRFIDTKRLVGFAKAKGVKIRVLRRVGHFVPAGVPVLTITSGDKLHQGDYAAVRTFFELGPTRTLQQDIEYGILQIVDIALKAISPAVNDPSTAISCIDQLSRILIRFAAREPLDTVIYDPPGVMRVSLPWLGFDRLLDSAFEQIRLYAKADMAVNLRMLRALGDIAATIPDATLRQLPVERSRRIVAGCADKFEPEERRELEARLAALEMMLQESSHRQPLPSQNAP
jgi:uncharacterized membrane protein